MSHEKFAEKEIENHCPLVNKFVTFGTCSKCPWSSIDYQGFIKSKCDCDYGCCKDEFYKTVGHICNFEKRG